MLCKQWPRMWISSGFYKFTLSSPPVQDVRSSGTKKTRINNGAAVFPFLPFFFFFFKDGICRLEKKIFAE